MDKSKVALFYGPRCSTAYRCMHIKHYHLTPSPEKKRIFAQFDKKLLLL